MNVALMVLETQRSISSTLNEIFWLQREPCLVSKPIQSNGNFVSWDNNLQDYNTVALIIPCNIISPAEQITFK